MSNNHNFSKEFQKNRTWYVYIIQCEDNTYYTGMTWNPNIRFEQHLSGFGGKYTQQHGVKKLVYLEMHEDFEVARKREMQVKGWSRKKKEQILIKNFTLG